MRWLVVLVLFGAVACSSGPAASVPTGSGAPRPSPTASALPGATATPSALGGGTSTVPTPSPTAAVPPSYAVLLDLFAGGGSYNLALVGGDGAVVARAHAAERTKIADAVELPYAMASKSRVYYLDGDRSIRYMKVDGSTGLATTVPGASRVHATFAVTPDDRRIAVALLDYSVSPVKLTLYVEDVGGAHHRVIFTSTNHYIWPVAWHSGQLVVAYLGPNQVPFKSKAVTYSSRDKINYPYGPSPYGGINFHVINPVTAVHEVIISGGGTSGLLSRAGSAVVQGDADDWKGSWLDWSSQHDYGTFSASGSLSPDGNMIAACCPLPGPGGQLVIWYHGDVTRVLPVTVTSVDWVGWLDNSHLVTGFYQAADGTPSAVDLETNTAAPIDAHGIVVAIFPSNLEP